MFGIVKRERGIVKEETRSGGLGVSQERINIEKLKRGKKKPNPENGWMGMFAVVSGGRKRRRRREEREMGGHWAVGYLLA